jgi:hypothetical protein
MSPFWVLHPPIMCCNSCGLPTAFRWSNTLRQIVESKIVPTTRYISEMTPRIRIKMRDIGRAIHGTDLRCLVRLEDIPSVCIVDEIFQMITKFNHPNVSFNLEPWVRLCIFW